MRLAVDLHVHLVEMPPPLAEALHPADPLPADVSREHRTEAVPPEPHGLVADTDVALEQQFFDVRSDSGNRIYISTTRRIASGEELESDAFTLTHSRSF